jgi:hypothetical protein
LAIYTLNQIGEHAMEIDEKINAVIDGMKKKPPKSAPVEHVRKYNRCDDCGYRRKSDRHVCNPNRRVINKHRKPSFKNVVPA